MSHPIKLSLQLLIISSTAIAIAALSIHLVMLQVLHVPYPNYGQVGLLGLLEPFGHLLALLILLDLIVNPLTTSFL
jgi:hypothetical protein